MITLIRTLAKRLPQHVACRTPTSVVNWLSSIPPAKNFEEDAMRFLLIAVAALCLLPAVASAQQPVQIWAGQNGPYEIHTWHHRTNNFDRAPYFATNPPVYYGDQRLVRTYGWTPYPYLGTQYPIHQAVVPMAPAQEGNGSLLPPPKAKRDKMEKKERRSLGA
jgi:hypothetical protein